LPLVHDLNHHVVVATFRAMRTQRLTKYHCRIIILIPKGGDDYRGIGLLEPMWKVCKRVMDLRLNAFDLHNSFHGCRDKHGTGTAGIEAKLAQQLAHLE
jgi:hypothetical protein